MRPTIASVAVPLLPLLLAGACAAGPQGGAAEEPPSPFANCAALTAPPASAAGSAPPANAASSAPPASAAGTKPLPDIRLPCFTGGESVALGSLRGPAVVNLWASWCQPCRKELPALQRLADSSRGRLHVVGVDTRDPRESARSLAVDLGIDYPNLVDRDELLLRAGLGPSALPVTLFVDGQGRIRHLDASGALDHVALTDLVRRHLGVATGS